MFAVGYFVKLPENQYRRTMKYLISIIALIGLHFTAKQHDAGLLFNREKPKFNIIDSLIKFEGGRDTLLYDEALDATLFISKANNRHYGVYVVSEKTLAFYQKLQNVWIATEEMPYEYPFSYAKGEDVNGDGVNDVRVACLSGSAGNSENTVFLYDKASGVFKHNKFYDLPNLAFDKKGKFIRSSWYAGAVHCQSKFKYKITGDSLIFDKGMSFCPDYDDIKKATFIEYTRKGGERIVIDSIKGKAGKLWTKFEKGFWDSEHDMY